MPGALGVVMAGPSEPGFGNNNNPHAVDPTNPREPGFANKPHAIDPPKDSKKTLPINRA
jgi:hypothetical protein